MSADNGVYVLPVKCFNGKDFWYVYARSAIENLTTYSDRLDGYNTRELLTFIVPSKRFTKEAGALAYAHRLAARIKVLEYGVVVLPLVKIEP